MNRMFITLALSILVASPFAAASDGECVVDVSFPNGTASSVCEDLGSGNYTADPLPRYPGGHVVFFISENHKTCRGDYFMPLVETEILWDPNVRVAFYFFVLVYCFMGVGIISEVFMGAIEVITSREVTVMKPNDEGELKEVSVLYWNETVANLTLMALGSSAPEILLSVGETIGSLINDTVKDGLGPSTIVGSAAYNLLIITGICITCIPNNERRVVKEFGVFNVTAFFSVFAYVWIFIVLRDEVVSLWEAFVTLGFFFLLVLLSYMQDRHLFGGCVSSRVNPVGHIAGWRSGKAISDEEPVYNSHMLKNDADRKKLVAHLLQAERSGDHPADLSNPEALAEFATAKLMEQSKLSRMRYRINAMRSITGGKRVVVDSDAIVKKSKFLKRLSRRPLIKSVRTLKREAEVQFNFSTSRYEAFENDKKVTLHVTRTLEENPSNDPYTVYYETSNGAALAGEDYEYASGMLMFQRNETSKDIEITIIDDNEYEPNENFFVTLKNPSSNANLGKNHVTEVVIIDDDTPGEIQFSQNAVVVTETAGVARVEVKRSNGTDGVVKVRYRTKDGTAKDGEDYHAAMDVLVFEHGESTKSFEVKIIDGSSYEKDSAFIVELEILNYPECGATYGENKQCGITITSDERFQATVDQVSMLMQINLEQLEVGTSSWREQFKDALAVVGEDGEPSNFDYAMHVVSLFWKLLFAIVPPTSYMGGWLTFWCSLALIGALTIVIGDFAGMFGCCLGVPTSTTAMTFVALGTSLPDTFASKSAAINDKYADASIGNVTGSNSVNVFLGLGLPWVIAACYKASKGEEYRVATGNLATTVMYFCIAASACISLLYTRRIMGWGELGGPVIPKYVSCAICIALWVMFLTLSLSN